jgi:hypothetical protein
MAPATARQIEYAGAPPDLFFGGVIFNHRLTAFVARWTCNLHDVVLLFHDLSGLFPENNRHDV